MPEKQSLDTKISVRGEGGTMYQFTVTLEDDISLPDNCFCVELVSQLDKARRICLVDPARKWRTYVYNYGPWCVERGPLDIETGVVPPLIENGIGHTTTPPIELITPDQDEWMSHDPTWSAEWVTIYFTLPVEIEPTFMFNEPDPVRDAFPMEFTLSGGKPPDDKKKMNRKKLRLIWE